MYISVLYLYNLFINTSKYTIYLQMCVYSCNYVHVIYIHVLVHILIHLYLYMYF